MGYTYISNGGPHPARSLLEHWNGKRWTVVHIRHPHTAFDGLNSISAVSSDDIWAVGFVGNYDQWGNDQTANMLLHWDGTTWTRVPD